MSNMVVVAERSRVLRMDRARLKRDLRGGVLSLKGALGATAAQTMVVGDLLEALPRVGEHTMLGLLRRVGIITPAGHPHPYKPVNTLTERQRDVLVREWERRSGGRAA